MALKEHLGLVFVSMLAAVPQVLFRSSYPGQPLLFRKSNRNVVNVGQTVPRLSADALKYSEIATVLNPIAHELDEETMSF